VQALMALAVVLARESLPADRADEGPLVRVRAQVRAEVVGAGEAFRAEGALEIGGVFLQPGFVCAAAAAAGRGGAFRG